MDKETLSNYGWIVICILVLACMLALATPFGNFIAEGFKATYVSFWQGGNAAIGGVGGIIKPTPPSAEQLQSMHKFEYYSSLYKRADGVNGAIADVNDGTIGKNADCDKKDAVAGIYIDENGIPNVVVLKDCTETQTTLITKDMVVNLGGKTVSYNLSVSGSQVAMGTNKAADITVTIDGRLNGSKIYATSTLANTSLCGLYINKGNIYNLDSLNIEVDHTVAGITSTRCVNVSNAKNVYVNNCEFKLNTSTPKGTVFHSSSENTILKNSSFINICPLTEAESLSTVQVGGNSQIDNCYIEGGLYNIALAKEDSKCYVSNSVLKSTNRNVVLSATNTEIYVEDSTLEFLPATHPDTVIDNTYCAFGFTSTNMVAGSAKNMNIYADNIKIVKKEGDAVLCHIQYQSANSALHISNSTGPEMHANIATSNGKIYWGVGNKFDYENMTILVNPGNTEKTDKTYRKP